MKISVYLQLLTVDEVVVELNWIERCNLNLVCPAMIILNSCPGIYKQFAVAWDTFN